ncbi:MAG: hypothetical protein HW401_92 [Parcubacteria group bacterium]|nr:hypothetical protein [Parcubacteria group bacterium]
MYFDKSIIIGFMIIFFFIMYWFAKALEKIKDDTYDIKSIIEDKFGNDD